MTFAGKYKQHMGSAVSLRRSLEVILKVAGQAAEDRYVVRAGGRLSTDIACARNNPTGRPSRLVWRRRHVGTHHVRPVASQTKAQLPASRPQGRAAWRLSGGAELLPSLLPKRGPRHISNDSRTESGMDHEKGPKGLFWSPQAGFGPHDSKPPTSTHPFAPFMQRPSHDQHDPAALPPPPRRSPRPADAVSWTPSAARQPWSLPATPAQLWASWAAQPAPLPATCPGPCCALGRVTALTPPPLPPPPVHSPSIASPAQSPAGAAVRSFPTSQQEAADVLGTNPCSHPHI